MRLFENVFCIQIGQRQFLIHYWCNLFNLCKTLHFPVGDLNENTAS